MGFIEGERFHDMRKDLIGYDRVRDFIGNES
jgi:hypothetical protein